MVDTEKRNKRQNAWQKENCDRINFVVPKGKKGEIKRAAESQGKSINQYIMEAILEKMEKKS